MKTMLDVIRDTKEAAFAARENRWEVTINGKTYVGELGFKVFNPDWTCRSMQYKVGNGYEEAGMPSLCNHGLHYCPVAANCFNYYSFDSENKVALVLAYGEIDKGDDKHCTNKLLIIREIPWGELLEIANQGKNNTGLNNTGDGNTGHRNTGDGNTGDGNTGDYNTGHRNTGDGNTGDGNTGDGNTGHRNTGDYNTGHRNTGDGNTGDGNFGSRCTGDFNLADDSTGVFCAERQKIRFFDKESDMNLAEWRQTEACKLLQQVRPASEWRPYSETTAEEDAAHPDIREKGGYLRTDENGQRFIEWWKNLSADQRAKIMGIPNFDKDKFKKITGIDVENDEAHTRCYEIKILPKPCYEVGDKVMLKDLDSRHDEHFMFGVNERMEKYSGLTATITNVEKEGRSMERYCYGIDLDTKNEWRWSASMFQGMVVNF